MELNLLVDCWIEIFAGRGLLKIVSFTSPSYQASDSLAEREPELLPSYGLLVLLLPGDVEQSGVELARLQVHQEQRGSLSSDHVLTLSGMEGSVEKSEERERGWGEVQTFGSASEMEPCLMICLSRVSTTS